MMTVIAFVFKNTLYHLLNPSRYPSGWQPYPGNYGTSLFVFHAGAWITAPGAFTVYLS